MKRLGMLVVAGMVAFTMTACEKPTSKQPEVKTEVEVMQPAKTSAEETKAAETAAPTEAQAAGAENQE